MNREEIDIEILPDGRIQYTIRGIKRNACESISEVLERLGHVEQEERTSEYYDLDDDARITVSGGE